MDSVLVKRAQAGDREAYEALARAAAPRLYATAYRIVRDADAADEAVQLTLVAMWQELPSLRDTARFDAWTYRLVVRFCLLDARRIRRTGVREIVMDPATADGSDAFAASDLRDELNRALGFEAQGPNSYGWAELNARGVEKAVPFYEKVFGWTTKRSPVPGSSEYIEFLLDGTSVAGATEMNPMAAPSVPNHWLVYFDVDDVPSAARKAVELGARKIVAPQSYTGGDFAILADPHGASFGLFKSSVNQR